MNSATQSHVAILRNLPAPIPALLTSDVKKISQRVSNGESESRKGAKGGAFDLLRGVSYIVTAAVIYFEPRETKSETRAAVFNSSL